MDFLTFLSVILGCLTVVALAVVGGGVYLARRAQTLAAQMVGVESSSLPIDEHGTIGYDPSKTDSRGFKR